MAKIGKIHAREDGQLVEVVPELAQSAINDGAGRNIEATYAKKDELTDGSVTKLGKDTVGSASKPIFLKDGVPTVAANAVATDVENRFSVQQHKAVPDIAMVPYTAYGRMQSVPYYVVNLGPKDSAYFVSLELAYRYETQNIHLEVNTSNIATSMKFYGTTPSAAIESVRFGAVVKDGRTYIVYNQTQNNVNSMIRVLFIQRSTSGVMIIPEEMNVTRVEDELVESISWFEPRAYVPGITPSADAPSTAFVTKDFIQKTDPATRLNNLVHTEGNETIHGIKTFSNVRKTVVSTPYGTIASFRSTDPACHLNPDTTYTDYGNIEWFDYNDVSIGQLRFNLASDGTTSIQARVKNSDGTNKYVTLAAGDVKP